MKRLTLSLTIAAALSAALICMAPVLAKPKAADREAVVAKLAELRLDPGLASTARFSERTRGDADLGLIDGYDASIALPGCRGRLVMALTQSHRVKEVYTRGDCRLDGVPRY